MLFYQGDGHLIYTSEIDHLTPLYKAFEQSAACLSVFLELLPGLIPFKSPYLHEIVPV